MAKIDLMNALDSSSDFSIKLQDIVKKALIINIYLNNGELIKVGDGSLEKIRISDIINIFIFVPPYHNILYFV